MRQIIYPNGYSRYTSQQASLARISSRISHSDSKTMYPFHLIDYSQTVHNKTTMITVLNSFH